ncbi:MAG: ABC transporter permease [Planctomycetota bacterium]
MRKIWTIAVREYKAMVATKAFLISIIMMPILMLGSLLAVNLLKNVVEVKDRQIAVHDAEGKLFQLLEAAAEARNTALSSALEAEKKASQGKEPTTAVNASEDEGLPTAVRGEFLHLRRLDAAEANDELRAQLSEQIRSGELYAFLEIPAGLARQSAGDLKVSFYSQDSSIAEARAWFSAVINEYLKNQRLAEAGIDPSLVAQASRPVPVSSMGLVSRSSSGSITAAREKNQMADIFLPMGAMMFMFLVIFMASQPMLEAVLEEKSQRIAEVLLGSANPFQLMLGKLIGTVGGSMTVFLIYLLGGYLVARQRGWLDNVPLELIPWFIIFQLLGVLFYASIFMAVVASVSQLKEASAMLMPVWMMLMLPIFIWLPIVQDPNGGLARGISFFPPATSTTMILRLATGVSIPLWELLLATSVLLIATILVVILAGRIFRVGMLWQGKVPKLTELLSWAFSG